MSQQKLFEKLSQKYRTPKQVQEFLRSCNYNKANTLISAERVFREKRAHCLEAAFFAAAVLEYRGYEPLVVSIESWDQLDHVLFVFQQKGKWGSIGRSRDDGLHGRQPIFRTLRDLVYSYVEPYVDGEGRIIGYALAHLDDAGADWRFSKKNLWKIERYLTEIKHAKINMSEVRYQKALRAYFGAGHKRQRYWW